MNGTNGTDSGNNSLATGSSAPHLCQNSWNSESESRSPNITNAAVATANKLSVVVKCSLLIILVIINFAGNGLTIQAIRTTRRLRTKTNFVVCSMTVSDVLVGMGEVLYVTWNMAVYVFDGEICKFKLVLVLAPPIQQVTVYAACFHISLLAIDRYIGPSFQNNISKSLLYLFIINMRNIENN